MGLPSVDLRRRLVESYRLGLCSSYEEAAEMFGVGRATVVRQGTFCISRGSAASVVWTAPGFLAMRRNFRMQPGRSAQMLGKKRVVGG